MQFHESDLIKKIVSFYHCPRNYYDNSSQHQACTALFTRATTHINAVHNKIQVLTCIISNMPKECCLIKGGQCIEQYLNSIELNTLSYDIIKKISLFSQSMHNILITRIDKYTMTSELLGKILFTRNTELIKKYFKKELAMPYHYEILCGNTLYYNDKLQSIDGKTFIDKYVNIMINHGICPTKNTILFAIIYKLPYDTIMRLLTFYNEISPSFLNAAFFGLNKEMVEFLLNDGHKVNDRCVHDLFTSQIHNIIPETNDYSLQYLYEMRQFIHKSYNQIKNDLNTYCWFLETITKTGYEMSFNDLKILSTHNIRNVYSKNFTIGNLELECEKSSNLQTIKNLVQMYNIKPNAQCVSNVCYNSRANTSVETIKFLYENGAPINMTILKDIVNHHYGLSPVIKYLFEICVDKYKKYDLLEQKKMENDIIIKKEKEKNKLKKDKSEKENNNIETPNIYETFDIDVSETQEVKIPSKLLKLFKLEKNTRLNCQMLRKILINFFNDKKLIQENNFTIQLPNELTQLLNLDFDELGTTLDLRYINAFCKVILDSYI